MIAIDCNGKIMHDNISLTTDNTTSDFLIRHWDNVTVEYDSIEQKVSFHNLTKNKRITSEISFGVLA
jgi:hypothetical protein